jgi:hypothetical protein
MNIGPAVHPYFTPHTLVLLVLSHDGVFLLFGKHMIEGPTVMGFRSQRVVIDANSFI